MVDIHTCNKWWYYERLGYSAARKRIIYLVDKLTLSKRYTKGVKFKRVINYAYTLRKLIQKDTCTPMFTAALFIIERTWKQPGYPSTEKQIKKL